MIDIWKITDVPAGLALTGYAGGLVVCAAVILYALVMLLITNAFWFVQLENVMELLFTFYDAGRFPVTIFPFWMRFILTFIVPIAFVTTVPAAVLIGRMTPAYGLLSIAIAAGLLYISHLYWQFAVRHYSSASS